MTKTNRRRFLKSGAAVSLLSPIALAQPPATDAAQKFHVALMILMLNDTYRGQFTNPSPPTGDLLYLQQKNSALYSEIYTKFKAGYSNGTNTHFLTPLTSVRQVFLTMSPAGAKYGTAGTCPCIAGTPCAAIKALVP
jgi:hypothetical protein